MENRQRFLVIGCARSGTTISQLALAGHPEISMFTGEIKPQPFFSEGITTFTYGNQNEIEKTQGWTRLFDAISTMHPKSHIKANGIKTVVYKVSDALLIKENIQQNFPNIKIVYVYRKNLLAQYASLLLAMKTGQWHSWSIPNSLPFKGLINIKKRSFGFYLKQCFWINEIIPSLEKTHEVLRFSYEDDILKSSFGKLFDFLDVQNINPHWIDSEKVAPDPEKYIERYEKRFTLFKRKQSKFDPNNTTNLETLLKKEYPFPFIRHWVNK